MKAFLFFIINMFVFLAWARPQIEIRARNELLQAKSVTLGDLADFKGFSGEIEQKWSPLVIFEKWDGSLTEISREELVAILKKEISADVEMKLLNPALIIPETVKLDKKKIALNEKELSESLLQAFRKLCKECQVEVFAVKVPKFVGTTADLNVDFAALELKASQIVPATIVVNGKSTEAFITVAARIKREVAVAKRPLQQGDRLQSGDFTLALVDVSNIYSSITTESDLAGKLLAHPIASGQPILKGDIKREAAVKRGQTVKVTTGNSFFEISTAGVADENGFVGDIVRVKSSDSNKVFSAKVVEEGKVILQ